ncbi:hypothetical protein HYU14_00790 [Candidatus Woesearchaeota archaeon]|nr:hypothetical protein [Candidatus Woesearchaeota archaeon]
MAKNSIKTGAGNKRTTAIPQIWGDGNLQRLSFLKGERLSFLKAEGLSLLKAQKLAAIFLLALIITFPISSTIAYAELINPAITGSKNIPGFVEANETITLQARARIAGDDDITPSQVPLFEPSGPNVLFIQGCAEEPNKVFRCTSFLSPSEVSQRTLSEKVFSIPLYLLRNDGTQEDSENVPGEVDELPPVFSGISISPLQAGFDDLTISFDVTDFGNSISQNCVGLKSLVVSSGSFVKEIGIQNPSCSLASGVSIDSEEIIDDKEFDGNITVTVKAADRFGQESSEKNFNVTLDRMEPEIKGEQSFQLLDGGLHEVFYSAGSQIVASARVNVTDSFLNISSIRADFSSLNPGNGIKSAACSFDGENASCSWAGILVDVSATGDFPIIINASDTLGNNATFEIIYHIGLDTTRPEVVSFSAGYQKSDKATSPINFFGQRENNITITLKESGSGFSKKNIALDLRNINSNLGRYDPDWCKKTSPELWECTWNNTQILSSNERVSDGQKEILILPAGSDDVGNALIGDLSQNITLDLSKPVLTGIRYTPSAPKAPEPLILTFTASDSSPELFVYANTSQISSREIIAGECDTSSKCRIEITDLFTAHINATVSLFARDIAGNIAEVKYPVTLFEPDAETQPNFFRIASVEPVPLFVDRKVASQIPLKLYIYTRLAKVGEPTIIQNSVDCTESANYINGAAYVPGAGSGQSALPELNRGYYLMNEGTLEPIIALESSQEIAKLEKDFVEYRCKFNLQVRDKTKVYAKPEVEEIKVRFTLRGNSLGDIQENLQKKMEGVNKDIQETEKDIQDLEKWVNIFGIYCKISSMMGALNSAIQAIKAALQPVLSSIFIACATCCAKCVDFGAACACATATMATWKGLCTSSSLLHKLVDGFFWPVGLPFRTFTSPWTIAGWFLKVGCMILYYCALSDWDQMVSLGGEVIRGALPKSGLGKIEERYKEYKDDTTVELVNGDYVQYNSQKDRMVVMSGPSYELERPVTYSLESTALMDVKLVGQPYIPVSDVLSVNDIPGGVSSSSNAKDRFLTRLANGNQHKEDSSQTINPSGNPSTSNSQQSPKAPGPVKKALGMGGSKSFLGLKKPSTKDTFPIQSTDLANSWNKDSTSSDIPFLSDKNLAFDPYKSIHYAEDSRCYPAIIYNKKKEKQIKCLYRNCIQNHLSAGQPTTICDFAYKERECLYVQSAQYLKNGYKGFFDNLFKALLKYAVFLIIGHWLAEGKCKVYFTPGTDAICADPPPSAGATYSVLCGTIGALFAYMEISSIMQSKFGFSDDKTELQGPDFCSGSEDGLG